MRTMTEHAWKRLISVARRIMRRDDPAPEAQIELDAASFTRGTLREGIRQHSFVIVRGLIDPNRIRYFNEVVIPESIAFYRNFKPENFESDSFKAFVARGRSVSREYFEGMISQDLLTDHLVEFARQGQDRLYDLISDPRIHGVLASAFPAACFSSSNVCHIRSIHPDHNSSLYDEKYWAEKLLLHCDLYYHQESHFTLNIWVPFMDVGAGVGRPSLELVDAPLSESIAYAKYKHADVGIRPLPAALTFDPDCDTEVASYFGQNKLVDLNLRVGDVAIFTGWTHHRTFVTREMNAGRTSAEVRIVGNSSALESLVPNT